MVERGSKSGPNPGSDEALSLGCLCAVLDNHHGREAPFAPDGWWITLGCPLHTPPELAGADSGGGSS